jgi:hypothetical protein
MAGNRAGAITVGKRKLWLIKVSNGSRAAARTPTNHILYLIVALLDLSSLIATHATPSKTKTCQLQVKSHPMTLLVNGMI